VTPEPAKPKRRISDEGIKRIIAATKKRWAAIRAAANKVQAKKTKVARMAKKAAKTASSE
jgi:hypothetical protein